TASIAASLPAYAALQPDRAQLAAPDAPSRSPNDAARPSAALASQTSGVRAGTTTAVARTSEEIATAYQSTKPDGRAATASLLAAAPPAAASVTAPQPAPAAEPLIPADAIHRLDPN